MPAIFRNAVLALLGVLLAGIAALWVFRVEVITATAGMFLDDDQVRITALRDMQIGSGSAAVAELDILLPAANLRLGIRDISLNYSPVDLVRSGTLQSLSINAMELTRIEPLPEQADAAAPALLLSDVLLLFREFPVRDLRISDITIPGRPEPLALNLLQDGDDFRLRISSGALELLVTLNQAADAGTAQLQLALNSAANTVAGATLTLTATNDVYQVGGTASVDIPDFDALLGAPLMELLALPLTSAQLDMELAAAIDDAFLDAAPAAIALDIAAASTLALPADVVAGLGALTLVFHDNAAIELEAGNSAITGTVPLSASGSWRQQPFEAEFVFDVAECRLAADYSCAIEAAGTLASGAVSLATIAPLTLNLRAGASVRLSGAEVAGKLEPLIVGGYTVNSGFSLRDISITAGDAVAGTLVASTYGFTATGPQGWLPSLDVDATLDLLPGQLGFTAPLIFRNAADSAGIVASGTYDIASGRADASVTLPPLVLTGEGTSLSSYLGGWPWPFDVMTGSVAAVLDVHWQPADASVQSTPATGTAATAAGTLTGSLSGSLQNTAGFYGDLFFRGLDSELSASLNTALALPVTTPPLTLTIADIDVGVPISNIAVDYDIDGASQAVNIASFRGELLGGSLSGEDVHYVFGQERNLLNLRFTGLRLENMLTLAEYDGVEATGAVSGMLPIVITPNGVEVEAGTLFAEEPGGAIRYLGVTSGGNLGVDLVNQALGNYQFESLESSIDYKPDGELLLQMKMQGHNPDMNNGQRINLNLNLSDNIPALLESLQAGRAIEEFVQGEYAR